MNLEEMNGVNGENQADYLDITQLVEGKVYTKIALVTSATPGTTKQQSGFAKFYLKDVNSNIVCARLFDVKDFAFCGIKLSSFKNRPVRLKFVAQEFNGSLSLVIDGAFGIEAYNGAFDYSRFIGKMEYGDEEIVQTGKIIFGDDWSLNPEWGTASLDNIGQGRVGAFMKVFELAFATISGYYNISGIDSKCLAKVLFTTMETLFVTKRNSNVYGVLESTKNFDYLTSINAKWMGDSLRGVIMDASKAMAGISKPSHIYSHLVLSAINSAITNVNLILVNNSMVLGTSSYVGGVSLSKF
jgi:hypothetical protein